MTKDGLITGADLMKIIDGYTVIDELSNDTADEWLMDELVNDKRIITALVLARKGDDLAAAEILRAIYRHAGEREGARTALEKEQAWAERGEWWYDQDKDEEWIKSHE